MSVYRADGSVGRLHQDDELSGEDVIPGFRCRVRSLFQRVAHPDRSGLQPGATGRSVSRKPRPDTFHRSTPS